MNKLARHLSLLRRMNPVVCSAVALLLLIGALFVYSAASGADEQQSKTLIARHCGWLFLGVAAFLAFAAADYRTLLRAVWPLYAVALCLLVLVLVAGRRAYGAQRWLSIQPFGLTIQPSEIAKLALILALAKLLGREEVGEKPWRSIAAALTIAGVPACLIFMQPNLSTATMLMPLAFVVLYAAGIPFKPLASTAGVLLIAAVIALFCLTRSDWPRRNGVAQRNPRTIGLAQYQKTRLMSFIRPGKDPLGAGWNKMQSEITVGSGALWGKGFRRGTQTLLGFLPRTVAHTDFIFSVVAEEAGFFGAGAVLTLFAVLFASLCLTAVRARDTAGRLLCVGVAAFLFAHTVVNIGMTIGLLPITGLPLPLLSYGGTFMVATMAALGMTQSVYIRARPEYGEMPEK